MCIHKCGELKIVGSTTQYRQDRSVKVMIFPKKYAKKQRMSTFPGGAYCVFISPKPDLKNRTKQNWVAMPTSGKILHRCHLSIENARADILISAYTHPVKPKNINMALGTYSMTSPVTKPVPLAVGNHHQKLKRPWPWYKLRNASNRVHGVHRPFFSDEDSGIWSTRVECRGRKIHAASSASGVSMVS